MITCLCEGPLVVMGDGRAALAYDREGGEAEPLTTSRICSIERSARILESSNTLLASAMVIAGGPRLAAAASAAVGRTLGLSALGGVLVGTGRLLGGSLLIVTPPIGRGLETLGGPLRPERGGLPGMHQDFV